MHVWLNKCCLLVVRDKKHVWGGLFIASEITDFLGFTMCHCGFLFALIGNEPFRRYNPSTERVLCQHSKCK